MGVVPLNRPFNIETNIVPAVINSLQDPLCQGRCRIQTAEMSGVQPTNLPWAKAAINHSQLTNDQGGTTESPHSFKLGDLILVYRTTGSQQDWTIHGHPGTTLSGQSQNSVGPQNFFWNSDLRTANTTSAKPKVTQTTYPQDGQPTWFNPGQVTSQLAQQPDVRQFYNAMGQKYNLPALYQQDLWANAQHILQSSAVGSPVTQVIMNQDQNFISEAQKNSQALQMLHRLRMELNTSDFNGFGNQANNGAITTFQGLLSGGGLGGGLSGIIGMVTNLFGVFNQMGQNSIQIGTQQNQAVANNQFISTPTQNVPANTENSALV